MFPVYSTFPPCSKTGLNRFGNLVGSTLSARVSTPLGELKEGTELSRDDFKDLLGQIDKGLRALPATAQVGLGAGVGGWVRIKDAFMDVGLRMRLYGWVHAACVCACACWCVCVSVCVVGMCQNSASFIG